MLYLVKGNFQKAIRWMAGSWMTPNEAALLGVVFVGLTALSYYLGFTYDNLRFCLLLVPVFLFLRMSMNALDGLLAREHKVVGLRTFNESRCINGCYCLGNPRLELYLSCRYGLQNFSACWYLCRGRRRENILSGKPDRALWMGIFSIVLFFAPSTLNTQDIIL